MYLEINYLSSEELDKIKDLLKDREVRTFRNIYQEVCRVEADCTLPQILNNKELDKLETDINYNAILDEISIDINDNADSVFQDLCDLTAETIKEYFNKK